jgi:hypothetical protein
VTSAIVGAVAVVTFATVVQAARTVWAVEKELTRRTLRARLRTGRTVAPALLAATTPTPKERRHIKP